MSPGFFIFHGFVMEKGLYKSDNDWRGSSAPCADPSCSGLRRLAAACGGLRRLAASGSVLRRLAAACGLWGALCRTVRNRTAEPSVRCSSRTDRHGRLCHPAGSGPPTPRRWAAPRGGRRSGRFASPPPLPPAVAPRCTCDGRHRPGTCPPVLSRVVGCCALRPPRTSDLGAGRGAGGVPGAAGGAAGERGLRCPPCAPSGRGRPGWAGLSRRR